MIDEKYLKFIKNTISKFDPGGENKYFIFGSSLRKDKFSDVDMGVEGNNRTNKNLQKLKEQFEESTFPYFVDIVDFDKASEKFKNHVKINEKTLCLN